MSDAIDDVNWALLKRLENKPHPSVEDISKDNVIHHLLDLAGIPKVLDHNDDTDARVYLAATTINRLKERLDRIISWHSRESAGGGMIGDFCVECGNRWPCDTRKMAEGTYSDEGA